VNLGVSAEVDDRAEEGEETLVGLEGLEEITQSLSGELLVVLGGDLREGITKTGSFSEEKKSQRLVFKKKRAIAFRVLLNKMVYLDNNLQVLANVVGQHLTENLEGVRHRQRLEEVHQELEVQEVSVHDGALDVEEISVVLQSALRGQRNSN
jgi:hypothetical protein